MLDIKLKTINEQEEKQKLIAQTTAWCFPNGKGSQIHSDRRRLSWGGGHTTQRTDDAS